MIMNLRKNVFFVFMSNLMSTIVGIISIIVLPKIISVSDYGLFQYYILFSTYTVYLHFGWCDGIYLSHLGENYDIVDKQKISGQLMLFIFYSLTIAFLDILFSIFLHDEQKSYLFYVLAFTIVFALLKTFFSIIVQMTNRMKWYSLIIISERMLYGVALVSFLLFGIRDYKILIFSDLLGKIIACFVGMYACRTIIRELFRWRFKFHDIREAWEYFNVGKYLLLATLASSMIVGIVQFYVEREWNVETFGRISLSFNVSKFLLIFVNAVGIVLAPAVKSFDSERTNNWIENLSFLLNVVIGALLILYYPIKAALQMWLPEYHDYFDYLSILFPLCLFESHYSLGLVPFIKALRKEKEMCLSNVAMVFAVVSLGWIASAHGGNLTALVMLIPICLSIRNLFLEYILLKKNFLNTAVSTVMLAFLFILFASFFGNYGIVLYGATYVVFLILNRGNVKRVFDR